MELNPVVIHCVGLMGIWVFQDGLASIWYYHKKETWRRNHSWRLARMLLGLGLVIISSVAIARI